MHGEFLRGGAIACESERDDGLRWVEGVMYLM